MSLTSKKEIDIEYKKIVARREGQVQSMVLGLLVLSDYGIRHRHSLI